MKNKKLLLILLPVLFISCISELKEPVMPSWDIELNFPMAIKNYTIEDVVKKQDQIQIDNTHPNKILKFTSDEIEKDTTLDFLFDNTLDMEGDTTLPVIGPSFGFDMVIAEDSLKIDSSTIQSGIVEYRITNNNIFTVNITIVFPGITRRSGGSIDTFKIAETVPGNQTKSFNISMNNYTYRQPPNQPPGQYGFGFWAKVSISSSFIGIGQNLQLFIKVKDLKYTSLAGQIKPFSLGTKRQVVENDLSGKLKEFFNAVLFDSVVVTLRTQNSIKGYDIGLKNLQLVGRYRNGNPPIYLLINGKNSLDTTILPNSTTSIKFSNQNTNINEFIKATPDSLELISTLIFNPGYKIGAMVTTDRISFSIKIEAYSKMRIQNAYVTDTLELDIEDSTRDRITKGNEAEIKTEIENGVPLTVQFVGYFLDRNKNKLFYFTRQTTQNLPGDTLINISGANVNSQGVVTTSSNSVIRFNLNKSDFEKFKNAQYAVVRFKLSSTNNQTVVLSAENRMKFKLSGRINYKIEENK